MPPRKKPVSAPKVAAENLIDPTLPDPEDAHLFEDDADGEDGDDSAEAPAHEAKPEPKAAPQAPAPEAKPVKIWGRLAPHDPDNGQPAKAINARRRLFTAGVWVEVSAADRAALASKIGQKPKGGAAVRMFQFVEGDRRPAR